MDADEVLAKAWQAVQNSGVPESLYDTAFKEAVQLLSPRADPDQVPRARRDAPLPPAPPSNEVSGVTSESPASEPVDSSALFSTLASESGVDEAALIEVFYFDADGTPHINVPGRKLGSSMTAKVRNIATGLAGVRYYVSDQPSLGVEAVRAEATLKSAYDVSNFGLHISSVPGATVSGSGSSKVLRVKPNEIEAAFKAMVNSARGIAN